MSRTNVSRRGCAPGAAGARGWSRADEAAGHYNLALQYKREGKVPDAIAECEKAIQLRLELRGGAHDARQPLPRDRATTPKAAAEYEKVVKLEPKDASRTATSASAYVRLKRLDDGIAELEQAVDLKPDDYETRVSLGFAYSRRATTSTRSSTLVKATELKPGRRGGLEQPGHRQLQDRRQGRRDRRVQEGDRAQARRRRAALRPGDRLPAPARRPTGDRRVQVAVQKNPRLAKAYYDLGILYSQEKKAAEARAAFEKYLQYGTNEDAASRKDAEERLETFKAHGQVGADLPRERAARSRAEQPSQRGAAPGETQSPAR